MNKLTLIIGNKNYSSWSLRPWVLMKYFEIPFEEVLIPLKQNNTKQKILQYSPTGKVPVLLHGKIAVWESLAIAEYLAELFKGKNLWPIETKRRALARSISAEMHSGFLGLRQNFPLNVSAKMGKSSTRDADRDIARVLEIWQNCRRDYKEEGEFLFGTFSVTDAMFAPVVFRFNTYGIKLTGLAQDYFKTMLTLPMMKEWQTAAMKEKFPWS